MLNKTRAILQAGMIGLLAQMLWAGSGVTLSVSNPTQDDWAEVPVVLPFDARLAALGDSPLMIEGPGGKSVVQRDDLNGDGTTDEIVFLVGLKAGQSKELTIKPRSGLDEPPSRAHCGMYLRGLVGPAWESDVIAYRVYWNGHTAFDIFGKSQPILSLEAYAAPGLNYHVQSKYGLDVLKVGPALGVGGFGVWVDDQICMAADTMKTYHVRANGPLRAVLDLEFIDWYMGKGKKEPGTHGPGYQRRLDMYARLSICAGQKWSQVDLRIEPVDKLPVPEVVVGVVKHEDTELIEVKDAGVVGRWGHQALGDHEKPKSADLGLGFAVDPQAVQVYAQNEYNNYVRLKAEDGQVRYRIHGSWEKEPDGAQSTAEYKEMLLKVARKKPVVKVH